MRRTQGAGWEFEEGLRHWGDLDRLLAATGRPVLLLEGTRKIDDGAAETIAAMGRLLAERYPSVLFRSGGAAGADEAFARGVNAVDPERMELVVARAPRKSYGPIRGSVWDLTSLSQTALKELAADVDAADGPAARLVEIHLGPHRRTALGVKGAYLLRDVMKVAGAPELGLPVASAALFWCNPDNPLAGGTGFTIRRCLRRRIPIATQRTWLPWR